MKPVSSINVIESCHQFFALVEYSRKPNVLLFNYSWKSMGKCYMAIIDEVSSCHFFPKHTPLLSKSAHFTVLWKLRTGNVLLCRVFSCVVHFQDTSVAVKKNSLLA